MYIEKSVKDGNSGKTVVTFVPLLRCILPRMFIMGASTICHINREPCFWPACMPEMTFIPGATTIILLNYLKSMKMPTCRTKSLFVIGINDILQGIPSKDIIYNLRNIVDHMRTLHTNSVVMLSYIAYCPEIVRDAYKFQQLRKVNAYIRHYHISNNHHTLRLDKLQKRGYFKSDGVHFTPAAKCLIAKDLSNILNNM